jgi:hypothetical protein
MSKAILIGPSTVNTATVTTAMIRQHLLDKYGIEAPDSAKKKSALVEMLQEQWALAGVVEPAKAVEKVGEQYREENEPWVRIRLNNDPNDRYNHPQYVNVQGRAITIPRNREVDVPQRFVTALRNAIRTEVHPETLDSVEVDRFGLQILIPNVGVSERKAVVHHKHPA